jgi:hypothetical protein
MSGDLTEVEICDLCGNETEDYSIVNGLVSCESCIENSSLENEEKEDSSSKICALCGWPINRVIKKGEVKELIKGIENWLNQNEGLSINIKHKLKKLEGKDLYFCRYDFFYLVKDIIEAENEALANKFEKEIASKYDFYGGIVS